MNDILDLIARIWSCACTAVVTSMLLVTAIFGGEFSWHVNLESLRRLVETIKNIL